MTDNITWDDESPAASAIPSNGSGIVWDDEAPKESPQLVPDKSFIYPEQERRQLGAAVVGAARNVPFAADIGSVVNAAKTYVGMHPTGVPTEGSFGERRAAAKQQIERAQKTLGEQYPGTALAGQVASAMYLPMARPAAGVAARLEPMVGSKLASALGTGTVGAGYGAAFGASEGDTVRERLRNAGVGATVGGIGGAAIPTIASGLGRAARFAAEKVGLGRPASVAERQLSEAYRTAPGDRMAMTPGQVSEATAAGQPILPIDVGGQAVKGLAKTSALISPEARAVLDTELRQRTQEQAPRFYDFAEQLVGKRLDDPDVLADLRQTARTYNNPAYAKAMAQGAGGVWNNRLGQLINHPWVKKAIPEAIDESNAAAVAAGKPAMKNPFVTDAAGNYVLPVDQRGNTIKPTLEFWDTVKKNIQGKISSAEATHANRGDPNTVRIGTQLKNALTGELYKMIPDYQTAVSGAGRYLGEESAFRFGPKFLKSTNAQEIAAGKNALANFTPEEAEMAKHSYMAERAEKYLGRDVNRDISKVFNSPQMKAKDVAMLGQADADKLEAFMLREGLMHNALSSLGGSDTARNVMALANFGARHGVGTIGGAAAGAVEGYREKGLDPTAIAKDAAAGAALGWMAQRGLNLASKSSLEIAKKLVSNDPAAIQEALDAVAGNPQALKALRGAYSASLAPVAAQRSLEWSGSPRSQERAQRASGGRIESRDYPAKKMSSLERAARRAHLDIAKELEPVMGMHDDVVADALGLAKGV